jgi:hypothetical protein
MFIVLTRTNNKQAARSIAMISVKLMQQVDMNHEKAKRYADALYVRLTAGLTPFI